MNGKDKLSVAALVLTLLGGLWLAAAPWLVELQHRTANWSTATVNDFWLGIGLVALATTALTTYVATALRSLHKSTSPDVDESTAEQS
ncbi:MAG: hypothetical protein GEV07_15255 [Streptosporangiales bacterium]|nr:hypothetical protein [Streptosporangiales bacterium]